MYYLKLLTIFVFSFAFVPIKSVGAFGKPHLIENRFKDSAASKALSPLVLYHLEKIHHPRTLRVFLAHTFPTQKLGFRTSNYSIDNEIEITDLSIGFTKPVQDIPRIVGNTKPLMISPDSRSVSTGRMRGLIELAKYVVIIFFTEENQETLETVMANVLLTVNRRWDRIIFITQTDRFLKTVMKHKITQDLKERHLVSLDNINTIWADPLLYDGGKMIPVKSVALIPDRELVGGNLNGRHLLAAACEFRPWVYVTGKDANGGNIFSGSHYGIVAAGAPIFNYTFEVNLESSYGEFWPNNQTWTGAFGRIFYPDQAHFVIYLSYEYDWNYGVDFATTFNICELQFLTNQPTTKLQWYAFILPFQLSVWFWIVFTFIMMGIIQFIVMYLYHGRRMTYLVIDTAMFLPYAMAMEQGLCDIPKGARYLALIWLFGTVVLGTGYKATLRERMTYPRAEIIPLKFEELAERQDYKITLFTIGAIERSYFETSPWPAMINLRQRMRYQKDVRKCLRDVYMTPHSVCIGWSSMIKQEAARHLTVNTRVEPLVFSKESPKLNIQSFAFQKDSIFVDSFSRITEGVAEAGLVPKWEAEINYFFKKEGIATLNTEKETELYRALIEQTKKDDSAQPLSVKNLWVIFVILPVGFVMGAVFFGIENYIWRKEEVDMYVKQKMRNSIFGTFMGADDNVDIVNVDVTSIYDNDVENQVNEKKAVNGDVKEVGEEDKMNVISQPLQKSILVHAKTVIEKDCEGITQLDGEWYDPFNLMQQVNAEGNGKKVRAKLNPDMYFGKLI